MQLKNNALLITAGWINGAAANSEQTFPVFDPATLEVVADVSDLGAVHTHDAIGAAKAALEAWKTSSVIERTTHVRGWADQIEANADDLATILCSENGKPYGQARGEALQCAALLRWFADAAELQHGEQYASPDGQQKNFTIKQAVGVVACITPWNFPAAAVAVKAGAAIVTGCTVVVKPSDETPLIALALAKLATQAGIPAGVVNIVPCKNPAAVGDALCASADVRMLSFTGSTKTGRHLYAACGATIKRLALELGGNAPFVVFADADLDKAVNDALGARFYNSGQICVGANRFLIQKEVYSAFARKLADRVSEMQAGNGFSESCDIGPMINRAAVDRLTYVVDSAVELGAEVLAGGGQDDPQTLFFQATVLANLSVEMPAYRTEVFGPVACLYEFSDEAEAIYLANDTDAGLSAYVYTNDQERLLRCSEALEAGVVGANSSNIFANDLPFGGMKQSGIGKEHGMQCLDEFVETKSICLG